MILKNKTPNPVIRILSNIIWFFVLLAICLLVVINYFHLTGFAFFSAIILFGSLLVFIWPLSQTIKREVMDDCLRIARNINAVSVKEIAQLNKHINKTTRDGYTLLARAMLSEDVELVKTLLSYGAKPEKMYADDELGLRATYGEYLDNPAMQYILAYKCAQEEGKLLEESTPFSSSPIEKEKKTMKFKL